MEKVVDVVGLYLSAPRTAATERRSSGSSWPASTPRCPPGWTCTSAASTGQCISGPQTIAGYLDPRDDEGRFLDHEGIRWYRTGDIVQTQEDGQLAFLGRRDDQVQILGHRVHLSEIDHMLGKCRGVDKAATVVVDERLVAFYTGQFRDQADLRGELAGLLPQNLVPRTIRHLAEFRLTINGKVDRKHLGALAREADAALAAATRGRRTRPVSSHPVDSTVCRPG